MSIEESNQFCKGWQFVELSQPIVQTIRLFTVFRPLNLSKIFIFNRPIRQHFIPTLDQIKYEVEDGVTPEGTQIRYGYDERLFPNFSWRGYAILTRLQVRPKGRG